MARRKAYPCRTAIGRWEAPNDFRNARENRQVKELLHLEHWSTVPRWEARIRWELGLPFNVQVFGFRARWRERWLRYVWRYDGEHCQLCGRSYVLWWAYDALYADVAQSLGLLCPSCFDRRAGKEGLVLRWRPEIYITLTLEASKPRHTEW
jgi:hypothetical protein